MGAVESVNKRTQIFRKVQVYSPHCSHCKEQLQGNGSMVTPWKCKCGEWVLNEQLDYYVK